MSVTFNENGLIVLEHIFFTGREELILCKISVSRSPSKVEEYFSHAKRYRFLFVCKKKAAQEHKAHPMNGVFCFCPAVCAAAASIYSRLLCSSTPDEHVLIELCSAQSTPCASKLLLAVPSFIILTSWKASKKQRMSFVTRTQRK